MSNSADGLPQILTSLQQLQVENNTLHKLLVASKSTTSSTPQTIKQNLPHLNPESYYKSTVNLHMSDSANSLPHILAALQQL